MGDCSASGRQKRVLRMLTAVALVALLEPLVSAAHAAGTDPRLMEADARAAIGGDPRNSAAWITLGVGLSGQGRHTEAISAYGEGLRLDPRVQVAWFLKGLSLFELGRYRDAEAAIRRALSLDPRDVASLHLLGDAYAKEGRIRKAASVFRKITRLAPYDGPAWYQLGRMLIGRNRPAAAIPVLEKCVDCQISDPNAWFLLAEALHACGRDRRAAEAMDAYLTLLGRDEVYEEARAAFARRFITVCRKRSARK